MGQLGRACRLQMNSIQIDTDPRPQARTRVALLGFGTVGSAIHRLLTEHREHIRAATGRDVEVVAALVRSSRDRRETPGSESREPVPLVDDVEAVFAARPDLICEALGGLEPARSIALRALDAGIPVVTANKQLVARHGPELFAAAHRGGAQLRFEASVCGAIPVVRMLRESLVAARIDGICGILNGTTNFILSAMSDEQSSYEDALARAHELGFAEPDPSDDVLGRDAAAKLAILAGIAFHSRVSPDDVSVCGITNVSAHDMAIADQLGHRIRLVGRAERHGDTIMCDVSPMLVPFAHALAPVRGATNAVLVSGAPFGEIAVQGAGAGGPETASALAGDIVGVLGSRPSFLTNDPQVLNLESGDTGTRCERHYVRLDVDDVPGVLASVAGRFAEHEVSIERVVQQVDATAGTATLVVTTHPSARAAVSLAVSECDTRQEAAIFPMLEVAT